MGKKDGRALALVPPPKQRIGIQELEVRLHASRSTIARWVKSGRLESPHYLGARRLWFVDQVERFEAGARTKPAAEARG